MKYIDFNSYKKIQKELEDIARKKNADYSSDGLIEFGIHGILARMNDKFSRIKNLYFKGGKNGKVKDEKIEDSVLDLINYSIYFIMLQRGILIRNGN